MPRAATRSNLNVLFIGNSFTARNDLPGLIAAIAAAADKRLDHRLISVGGASLRRHWNGGEARKAIETGGHDSVVLQEQSTLPIKNRQRMHDNVRLFDGAIRAAGARTALYLTWARRHAPETQQLITTAYESIAAEVRAQLIPAGVAWEQFLRKHDQPVLHDADGSHPTLAGSYLAACVAFAMLFRADLPRGVEIPGLAPADEQRLRTVASRCIDSLR
jgi:hypothetical protein